MNNLFEKIKQTNVPKLKRIQKSTQVYFQLIVDTNGAYLQVIDKKGKKLDPDYRLYNGASRDVLKIIQDIEKKKNMMINWETSSDYLYLDDNELESIVDTMCLILDKVLL